jgi:hypothetical protein
MTFLDTIQGVIARRVLLNYRIDPSVLAQVIPAPFRPKLYRGHAIAGVCMIRFRDLRPQFMPSWSGMTSENAAHRVAVEWDEDGEPREGVFIPRRDTNSPFNHALGGRVFPGIFNRSTFDVRDAQGAVTVRIIRADGGEEIAFSARPADRLPTSSIFPSVAEAAGFFSMGATGYSATHREGHYHGMELKSLSWSIEPLEVEHARSCFFDDTTRFPRGSAELDCALIMRDIDHEWHSRPDLFVAHDRHGLTKRRP